MDVSRKDVTSVMKVIEEQCKILRPDLFDVEGVKVLKKWVRNYMGYIAKVIALKYYWNYIEI